MKIGPVIELLSGKCVPVPQNSGATVNYGNVTDITCNKAGLYEQVAITMASIATQVLVYVDRR